MISSVRKGTRCDVTLDGRWGELTCCDCYLFEPTLRALLIQNLFDWNELDRSVEENGDQKGHVVQTQASEQLVVSIQHESGQHGEKSESTQQSGIALKYDLIAPVWL